MLVRIEYCDVYEVEVPNEIFNDIEDEGDMAEAFWRYSDKHIELERYETDSYLLNVSFEKA